MKTVIRSFFRTVRLILTPFMLGAEKLTTPKPVDRSPEDLAKLDKAAESLALYQFRACPFCIRVRKELTRLGVHPELRDAQHDAQHRQALQAGGGRVKVPCLLINHDDGRREWLYESAVINAWLREHFTAPA